MTITPFILRLDCAQPTRHLDARTCKSCMSSERGKKSEAEAETLLKLSRNLIADEVSNLPRYLAPVRLCALHYTALCCNVRKYLLVAAVR
jgi:hypothetical protein